MAIPKSNAKLSEMGPDLDMGILPLSNKLLKQRAGNFSGAGSISTADLRGTVAGTMPLTGLWDSSNPAKRSESKWDIFEGAHPGLLTAKDVQQNSNGVYSYSWSQKAGNADGGVLTYHFGKLPSSGKFKIEFGPFVFTSTSQNTFFQVEVIGSKTNYLAGGNKYYLSTRPTSGASGFTSNEFTIDSAYPYLTFTLGLFVNPQSSTATRTGTLDSAKAYLV